MSVLQIADLFCGAGGTSTGALEAARALGYRPRLTAVNHWPVAVATHSANHPDARHLCASVDSLNPRDLFREGELDILWASPECTHHSRARGGRPMSDQSRASGWCVTRWAEALQPETIFVENVPEYVEWGPLRRDGKPFRRRKGETFQAWLRTLESLGYSVDYRILCSADYGDATERYRLFVQAVRGRRRIVWPAPTHHKDPPTPQVARWRGVRECIDWSIPSPSIYQRTRPLKPNTLRRIEEGLWRFGLAPSLVCMEHRGAVRSVDRPAPTITTAKGGAFGLVEPFLLPQHTGGACRQLSDPCPTITGAGAHALVEPFLVNLRGTSDSQIRGCASALDHPAKTISAGGIHAGLVEPYLVEYYGTGGAKPVDRPCPTITTKQRFGLAEPLLVRVGDNVYRLDIRFRMLQPHELAAAQGFPLGYQFTGTKTDAVKQIGNAVPCGFARALITAQLRQKP